jgi:hypothetical protein
MSLRAPLSVRLRTTVLDRHITDLVSDVTFGSTSPGGYAECTISLHSPIRFTAAEVAQFGRVYIYDAHSAAVVWEGRLQDPGRTAGAAGEVYELAAVGGQSHLQDDNRQLIYADTDLSNWQQVDIFTPAATVSHISDAGDGEPVLSLRIPQGTSVDGSGAGAVQSRCVVAHEGIAEAGMKLAWISFDWDSGLTAATITAAMYAGTKGTALADVGWFATFNIAGGGTSRIVIGNWTNGRNWPLLRFHYTGGAGNVSADTWWLQFKNLAVRTMLFDKAGVERTTGYSAATVLASEVVEDLLGRVLSSTIDSANATVTATSFGIEQLAYPDGVNPAKVLDDLILFEQGYTWHIWESNPDNDKFHFEWVPWPTAVRYEADVVDGFSAPASGNTLYNQVRVRWHNRGFVHTSLLTQDVPQLTAAGLTRTAFIDLGDDASTQGNAYRVGYQFLEEHRYPVNAGRLTVRGPIVDLVLGRMVQPWEIRSGSLIRVRGIAANPNSLNNAGRDGVTVFKVAAVSYSTSDAAATLDLDSYAPSVTRALAALMKRPAIRRR